MCCLTNTGPLAGALDIDEVHPTPASPWLVQPFVEGETVCTYSAVHEGAVSSHLMYRIPRQRKHSTGIQFEAIDATESLKLIEPIVAELGYTGQISFDFLVTDDGLTFVECNPRATDGLLLMPADELAAGLLDPRPETFVLEPGGQVQLSLAVLADGFADQLKGLPQSIDDLAQVRDAGSGWNDPLPTLYSALAICHSVGQSFREHIGQIVAIAGDMNWDGEHTRRHVKGRRHAAHPSPEPPARRRILGPRRQGPRAPVGKCGEPPQRSRSAAAGQPNRALLDCRGWSGATKHVESRFQSFS